MLIALQLLAVFALILLNGFFAMSEMAIVTSRSAVLRQRAQSGSRGARVALELVSEPGQMLAAVQIGITLVGVLASALSGAAIALRLGAELNAVPWIAPNGEEVAFAIVVLAITFLSVVLGEIVPKRIALTDPEGIAIAAAPTLRLVASAFRPFVALIGAATSITLRMLGRDDAPARRASEEDVRHLLTEATAAKAIDPVEAEMVRRVIRLADRSIQTVMTPRVEVAWVDLDQPAGTIAEEIAATGFSRVVAARGGVDNAEGIIRTRDLAAQLASGAAPDAAALLRKAEILPDTATILDALSAFQRSATHMVLIIDEHGGLQGVATPVDVLEAIGGSLAEDVEAAAPLIRPHGAGFIVDGRTPVDEIKSAIGIDMEVSDDIQSVAGLVMSALGRLPVEGEAVEIAGWRFEVLKIKGRRIERVHVAAARTPA